MEGGKGGDLNGLQLGTQPVDPTQASSILFAAAGYGGSGQKGGAGGNVISSALGSVSGNMSIFAGAGGAGVMLGGSGGALTNLTINTPQVDLGAKTVLHAGNGGIATGSGATGGVGGSISGIFQSKDLNSAIDLIEAGNGGNSAAGLGGRGGSVSSVKTIGFIGKPGDGIDSYGAFGTDGDPQGIFAGRGGLGSGATAASGGVTSVTARQIATIAAAYDATSETFGVASIVSGIKADIIGYDADHDGIFDTAGAPGASPSGTTPVDGFILATVIQGINTLRMPVTFNA
jgi:hypothetical protein